MHVEVRDAHWQIVIFGFCFRHILCSPSSECLILRALRQAGWVNITCRIGDHVDPGICPQQFGTKARKVFLCARICDIHWYGVVQAEHMGGEICMIYVLTWVMCWHRYVWYAYVRVCMYVYTCARKVSLISHLFLTAKLPFSQVKQAFQV